MPVQIPSALMGSLKLLPHFDETAFVDAHLNESPDTAVRMNPAKPAENPQLFIHSPVGWCSHGFYLNERPSFTLDPLFHAGSYYVQEASSMFLEQAFKQTCVVEDPCVVLDLCAAPGGKSTLLQSLISSDSLLVSNEVIKSRTSILTENITKWGAANCVVTNNDPKDFKRLPGFFDVVVVDAPCSGSGLFRKDPDSVKEWSMGNVQLCSQRQQRILADVLPALKQDGLLIYSTCSYSPEECEDICDWLLLQNLEPIKLQISKDWNIEETCSTQQAYGYRFYPHRLKGEGFFIAVFKNRNHAASPQPSTAPKLMMASAKEAGQLTELVHLKSNLSVFKFNEVLMAFPENQLIHLQQLQNKLYVKKAGVSIGAFMHQELVPSHQLAMSGFNVSFPFIDVDLNTALDYLRRANTMFGQFEKGWNLIRYQGLPLGFVKVLQGRVNNYYPKEWRILNK